MPATLVNRVAATLRPNEHPYMNGAWTPTFEEWDATDLTVIGEIPRDLDGVYIRNTENPVHDPIGTYHPFDGDGMIHAMSFQDGKASYRNRFVRTKGSPRRPRPAGRSGRGSPGIRASPSAPAGARRGR